MKTGSGAHPGEERMEAYAMGVLPKDEILSFEQHLLLCEACQERQKEMDLYVHAMRDAARQIREEEAAGKKLARSVGN